jgi:hypothetical protein
MPNASRIASNDLPARFDLPDGLEVISQDIPAIVEAIARTARWVHPEIFRALPLWYPEIARAQREWNATYTQQFQRRETNVRAQKALFAALGSPVKPNWAVCHIWGYDDPRFAQQGIIVRNARYYSCVGNMVLVPAPLKGATDTIPEVKRMLRLCAYALYSWVCDHVSVQAEAQAVGNGEWFPNLSYPTIWPRGHKSTVLPPGMTKPTKHALGAIDRRKAKLRSLLAGELPQEVREQIQDALAHWKIAL